MLIRCRNPKNCIQSLGRNLHPESMILSDHGIHFTHPEYQQSVKEIGLLQSISRRKNCLDNAPIKSFLAIFKMKWITEKPKEFSKITCQRLSVGLTP